MRRRSFSKQLITKLKTDPIPDWSATLAYYFMLSIFPLIIFLLAIVPYFNLDNTEIEGFIGDYLPEEIATLFSSTIIETVNEPSGGLLSFGILATIWSASNGLNALIRAINRSYDIEETRNFIKLRLFSIIMTVGMIVTIVITLVMPVFGNVIIGFLESYMALPQETSSFLNVLRYVIGIGFMILLLTLLYWISPNVKLRIKEVIVGAVVATLGWQLVSLFFSIYVSNFGNYSATYGSLGGVIILMLWFFITGIMLVLGGQINAVIYQRKRFL
ncbi:YihY/virulence factor BrkB family protein [Alkalicoccobacillus porphyridii]|uniref:YihY/virulence factor BrkB family protein n=1 Tax=Alkalicoccobacillus porphyridii TaxID=2597270 RepID=A0A554A3C7_9BACI|nr:YihY/virulence factor BrkB family protein [Alkalicoccobacillus porphyridii]TSB48191.1 YihY/virulence factor BrkB family protein [Alkalicoccobacillus porphyridii]